MIIKTRNRHSEKHQAVAYEPKETLATLCDYLAGIKIPRTKPRFFAESQKLYGFGFSHLYSFSDVFSIAPGISLRETTTLSTRPYFFASSADIKLSRSVDFSISSSVRPECLARISLSRSFRRRISLAWMLMSVA